MGLHRFLAIVLNLALLGTLVSCSRESPLKENVSLRNNHSRVFVSTTNFENPQNFLDSLANTPVNEADTLPDTLTVTINDTVYMMGVLPRHVDKIYRFQWNLTQKDGKDTVIISDNATPQAWTYSEAGIYYPLFIATDGNNATDTAGTNTKQAYIKVIDTKPELSVPSDTLWTRHKGNITFPISASDSFGSIEKILIDLDASGKGEPKEWKYTKDEEKEDIYFLTVENDSVYIDSLGNQTIYVIAVDDDGNETKDSVYLHFNQLPKLSIISPEDGSRHYTSEGSFFFYYKVTDVDNPKDIRYTIWAQKSLNGKPPSTAFTEDDLIVENYVLNMFEPRNEKGENIITLLKSPSKELEGRIYWEMLATDGYDTVWMDRIKTSTSTSRPWNFFIGKKNSSEAVFTGIAKQQGRTDNSGIHIEFSDGNKIYDATTDANGNYTVTVDSSGTFTVTARSTVSKEYATYVLKDLYIESGEYPVPEILLKDTVAPVLLVDNVDTLHERNYVMTIYVRDLGTNIDTITAAYDDKNQTITCGKMKGEAVANCKLNLTSMTDGTHHLTYTAKDLAGNKKSLNQTIVIDATTMTLDVNGAQKEVIASDEELVFTAQINNALPAAEFVTWSWEVEGEPQTEKTAVDENGKATFTLKFTDIPTAKPDVDYIMTASFEENGVSLKSQVKFGVLGINPVIMFTEPGFTTTVSINDPITFKVKALRGQGGNDIEITWECGSNISAGFTCPTNEETGILAFSKKGTYKVIAKVQDKVDADKKGADTVTVEVISDPPSITANTQEKIFKIRTKVDVQVTASDKFGTVNKIAWNCYNAQKGVTPILDPDQEKIIDSPAATVTETISITMPGSETDSYTCYFKAYDDDDEYDADTLVFTALLDKPTVTLATHSETVKINAVVPIKAIAHDELGSIEEYNIACEDNLKDLGNPSWTVMPGPETSVKMPSTAMDKYYCVVMVKDDDGNEARDTATYKIVFGRPTVTAMLPDAFNVVTIKDTIEVSAIAKDSLGTLVKYEWGCGPAGAENIGTNSTSTSTPYAKLVMPTSPQDKYKCVIRVTDDDGNTAKDSVFLKVILAPPTVTVDNKNVTIREGYNIQLGATATDNNGVTSDPGAIVKREWSCGTPDQIAKNWRTVSAYDTVWKAPAPEAYFYCIARATDNDGNVATDTMSFKFSTDLPKIWVKDELIYINIGDGFSLDATVNDVWQGINWFTWECVSTKDGKTLEKSVPKYDYGKNNKSFRVPKDSSYSEKGTDMYCIVSAEEASTKATFSDTTTVRIMEQHPEGVITAADTVYLWSGDEAVDDEAIYFYTKEWGGMNSKLGELGDKNNQVFNWKFSNIKNSGSFYQGNPDGSLDTSTAEFNSAFIRSTSEGSMTITLDYHDSTMNPTTSAFKARHQAAEVSRKVYFSKAWKNLVKDTVIAQAKGLYTAPAMTMVNNIPVVAYMSAPNKVRAMALKNGSWSEIATVTTADSITAIKIATNKTDLFLGTLESTNTFSVFKSAGATSDFAKQGSITATASPKLLCNPSSKAPIVLYVGKSDKLNYLATYGGSTWTSKNIISFKENNRTMKFREITGEFTTDGNLVIVAIDTTTNYRATSALLNSSYTQQSINKNFASDVNGVSLAASGTNTMYMGFLNRNVEAYGPYVYKASINGNSLSWNKSGVYAKQIFEGYIAYHIHLVTAGDKVYAAIDDAGRTNLSQIHVFRLENGKWHFHGENQLPYFGGNFYTANKYYLRGSSPMLAIDNDGKVFLSMLARATSDKSNNNGPIVMKYVADSWEIH